MKISVIIPTYNRANLVVNAIESALEQTYAPHEVVVVDDGSTDGTWEVLKKKFGDQIRYCWGENSGPSAARNRGIAEARGEWIAFLDSDDLWMPDKLDRQVKALEKYPDCGVCFTNAKFVNSTALDTTVFEHDGKKFEGETGMLRDTLRHVANPPTGVWNPTMLIWSDILKQLGGFDLNLSLCEDDELIFRLGTVTKFCYVNLPLASFDRKAERHIGVSRQWHDSDYCLRQHQYRFEKRAQMSSGFPVDVQKSVRASLRSVHSRWANWYLQQGDVVNALLSARRGLHYGCSVPLLLKYLLIATAPGTTKKLLAAKHHESGVVGAPQ
jgi:glycosyltransferase involved in cell wall biosynthesis